jgi:hypothetical protein
MNYAVIYASLIAKAGNRVQPDGYVERHHVMPKALGGSDDKLNIVCLTAKEHFVAHMLLAKIHGGLMWQAIMVMKGGKNRYINGRLFEIARKKAPFEREKAIRQKRLSDPFFDARMHAVRSRATENRREGYQKEAGRLFTVRFNAEPVYAKTISDKRKKAKAASTAAVYSRDANRVRLVRTLRLGGANYQTIREKTGFFPSVISGILNNKKYIGVGVI